MSAPSIRELSSMSLIRPFLTQSLQVLFERGPPLLELRHRQRQQLLGRERRQRGRPRAARRGRGRGGEGQLAAQLFVEGVELSKPDDAVPDAVDVDVVSLERVVRVMVARWL